MSGVKQVQGSGDYNFDLDIDLLEAESNRNDPAEHLPDDGFDNLVKSPLAAGAVPCDESRLAGDR